MTIKKRLFISNILMLVIPAVLAVLALAAGVLAFFATSLPDSGYRLINRHELDETRAELTALAGEWLDGGSGTAARLESLCSRNSMCLIIESSGTEAARFGVPAPESAALDGALAALGGTGTVSDGEYELCGESGDGYAVRIYNPVVTVDAHSLKVRAAIFAAAVVAAVLLAVLLTNRFLTRYIFRHICGPLQTLTEGVHQIRDGNLTHRIEYTDEDEFKPVCEDFNDMAERLRGGVERSRREEESRKELLAGISHDVRSPLTSIRAYVEGLLDGVADTPEKRERYLRIIRGKTEEIDDMVRKLFLFSKLDMGEYPYSPERLDAAQEISDFVSASADDYLRRGLRIRPGPLPEGACIDADPTCLRSVLTNLLDNSAKYRSKPTGTAVITAEARGGRLILRVDDDGPGVPEEALPKLFDVFYRSDPSRQNPKQGSGLGLAIAAKAAGRMGGTIRAANLCGGGLGVELEIPLAKEEET